MKGTNFLKPLEYNIIAEGEKWRQGDVILGILKIKNHGAEIIELPILKITLALGNFKKVKTKIIDKTKNFFETINESVLKEKIIIQPNEELEFAWEFKIPEDCPITDKSGSAFLTYQTSTEEAAPTGQLELVVEPKIIINQFLEIFKNYLRFKIGPMKSSKGMVEIKLGPPSSRELKHVESLVLRIKEVEKTLYLDYTFSLHMFETVGGNLIAQKKVKQIEQKFQAKQYYEHGDYLNQDFLIASINEAIKEITPKFFA